ncbi:MAG: helix-turn-helix transcriptional regulator [Spirosomataceae bacterium]
MLFGNKVRELREKQGLVLRQLAAALEIDTATMSKIELGARQARKEQVTQLAEILNADNEYLYTLWLASKVYEVIEGEDMAIEALKVAEEEVQYHKSGRA